MPFTEIPKEMPRQIKQKRGLAYAVAAVIAVAVLAAAFAAQGAAPDIRLETRVLGQDQWLKGSHAALRIITLDHYTESPLAGTPVEAVLKPRNGGNTTLLYRGRTGGQGTVEAAFPVPDVPEGQYTLLVTAKALGETDEITAPVRIRRQIRVLLTTDKPLYQPGQTMHIRALALQIPSLKPASSERCIFEVMDAKGNKVYKKSLELSEFGVAGSTFQLATEVNRGAWTVRAIVGDEETEKQVTVDRYVLPKFKIRLETDKKFYLPGEQVNATVHADYFFGKPVDGAKVVVRLATFDVGFNDFAEIIGTTDEAGVFKFEQRLSQTFVGQPLEQGNAFFKAEVSVTDGADHTEKITSTVPVAKDPMKVLLIPEGGELIPDVENIVYVSVSYPDGTPAKGVRFLLLENVKPGDPLDHKSQELQTNDLGIGQVRVRPSGESLPVYVAARDDRRNQVERYETLGVRHTEEAVLLRTDRAIARAGEELTLYALTSRPSGTLYIDAVRDGQTILTKTLPVVRGKGEMRLPLTADMAGTLQIHAYRISRTGNIVRDSRTVYVTPADDLKIRVSTDREQYLPGKPARISFSVTDSRGRGLAAALGITVVDESVYALQEMQPGLERIYFMLEKELAEPKYEIHGITPGEIVKPLPEGRPAPLPVEKQEAAKVLFAAVEKQRIESGRPVFTLQADSYAQKIEKVREDLAREAREHFRAISEAIVRFYASGTRTTLEELGGIHYLVREGKLPRAVLSDRWGTPYEFQGSPWGGYRSGLAMISAGPDRRKGTVDDIILLGYPGTAEAELVREVEFASGRPGRLREDVWFRGRGGFAGFGEGRWGLVQRAAMAPDAVTSEEAIPLAAVAKEAGPAPARPEVRIRSYFPETLYFNPALITDPSGKAAITVDMADSITSWRLTVMGSSLNGLLGSATHGITVFQDFFIDIDLPVALTQNDEVTIPIAVYNYLPAEQKVDLVLTKEPWFDLEGAETKTLEIPGNSVRGASFRIRVKQIGWHTLTVHGYGAKMNDAIRREIEVVPDGERIEQAINDRLEGDVTKTITIPAEAIDGASNILVKVYPGLFSQVVEGMDSLLRMPFGCFEQTSSVTYPNILALDYMRRTRQGNPEIEMKAEQYINIGYQRLVSYECKGGGFEWFGNDPANQVLTAYGLLEFADMSRVYEVDPALIGRTQEWLLGKQAKDGSWTPDKGGIAEGAINRQTDEFRTTAYILWALGSSGSDAEGVARGLGYLSANWAKVDDPYALALAANAFLATPDGRSKCMELCQKLVDLRKKDENGVYWTTPGNTAVSSTGLCADIETTALAALALMKTGRYADVVNDALTFLIKHKDPHGTWGSTQATIFALKALIGSLEGTAPEIDADVTVLINGQEAGRFRITPEDSDVLRQVDCKKWVREGDNEIEIRFRGKGSSLYSISAYHYTPWSRVAPEKKLMDITVSFDRTRLQTDDIVTSTVKVAFNGRGTANMIIVDLGTPPAFDVLAEDLEAYVKDGTFQKYTLTGRQAIIYIEKLEAGKPLEFRYRMKAKFPIRAKTPRSEVYQYYDPDRRAVAAPVEMEVSGG